MASASPTLPAEFVSYGILVSFEEGSFGGTGGSPLSSGLPMPSDNQFKSTYSVNLGKADLPMCLYPTSFATDAKSFCSKNSVRQIIQS